MFLTNLFLRFLYDRPMICLSDFTPKNFIEVVFSKFLISIFKSGIPANVYLVF